MDDQLYLFEILIDNIHFEDVVAEVPRKKLIVVSVKLGNIVTLEIRSETLPQSGEGPSKRHIEFKSGKSYLCSLSANGLLDILDKQPIEISLGLRGDVVPIGSSVTPWDECYKEMVLTSANPEEFVAPATTVNSIYIMGNDVIKGSIQMFLRLSCFGKSIQTQFEVLQEPGAPNRQFIFKTCNTATTFACSRYGKGSSHEFIPVNAIFNAGSIRRAATEKPNMKSVSWTAINQQLLAVATRTSASVADNGSEFLFPEYLNMVPPMKDSAQTFDIVSLAGRPDEDKFLDFLTGKKLEDPNRSTITLSVLDFIKRNDEDTDVDAYKTTSLFRNIQDNSTRKKLFDIKGPYEKIVEDNSIEDSFHKYSECQKSRSCKTIDIGPTFHTDQKNNLKKTIMPKSIILFESISGVKDYKNNKNQTTRSVLRLRGGGLSGCEPLRLRGGALSKSPIAECREVMEQFDKVLEEYRKALSPCGHIACNYAPNITEAICQTACGMKPEEGINTEGCGHPACQYAKYKSALMAMDADIEKQFVGPAILGNCGHPKCSYQTEPVLPPIHWDCPDPLPIGKCKNPNCPYAAQDTGNKLASTKGPCGSNQCPYVPPAPCPSPNCPFKRLPPCADAKKAIMDKAENTPKKNKETFATCPFDNPPTIVNMMEYYCDNPDCEALNKASSGDCGTKPTLCTSPNCPYKNLKKKSTESDTAQGCQNPECPMKKQSSSSSSNPSSVSKCCNNPNCPYGKSSTESASSSCSNPNCPQAISSSESSKCSNPDCPYQKGSQESTKEACANPECPYNAPSLESCKNPECPFRTLGALVSNESCDNPECPYKKGSKTTSQESECECENPLCPSRRDTCLNPACPFNLRGYEPCTNPQCPHRKFAVGTDLGYCATPDPSFNEYCAEKTCPMYDPDQLNLERSRRIPQDEGDHIVKLGSHLIEQRSVEILTGSKHSFYNRAPCILRTCKFMGGNLKCVDCAVGTGERRKGPCPKTCPGDPLCPLAAARSLRKATKGQEPTFKVRSKSKKKEKKKEQAERAVEHYPGFKIGHRECVMPYFFVPPKMGWLWNIHTPCLNLKPRRGWRPGAICKTVAKAIIKHRKLQLMNPQGERRKSKPRNRYAFQGEMICPKPTLEVKKREGMYLITMNPLKDPKVLKTNENPYLDCTPLQFKVEKHNRLDPDTLCTDEGEHYKLDSSSNDELDIEVTTPAGIIHPDRVVQKKEVKTDETQYNPKDVPKKEKPGKKKKGKDKGKGKGKGKKKGKKGKK